MAQERPLQNKSRFWLAVVGITVLVLVLIGFVAVFLFSINKVFNPEPQANSEQHKQAAALQALENPAIGDTVYFGDLYWKVLDTQGGRALLITEEIVERYPYHDSFTEATWETSSVRAYLNDGFLKAHFSTEERKRIAQTAVVDDGNPSYEVPGGNDSQDQLFLLSIGEAYSYFAYKDDRVAREQGPAYVWWLRSPGKTAKFAAYVHSDGDINIDGNMVSNANYGVRPVLWLVL